MHSNSQHDGSEVGGRESARNARLIATAVDSTTAGLGVQWDYKMKRMVGQYKGHTFTPPSNKFNMITDKLSTVAAAENGGKDNATSGLIMDNIT